MPKLCRLSFRHRTEIPSQPAGRSQGNTNYCRNATFSDLGELDDRGYVYNMDRAGSGLTILQFTGDALDVVTGHGEEDER